MARWRRRQKVLIPQNVNGVSEARLGYFVKKFGLSLAGLINPPEAEQSQRKKKTCQRFRAFNQHQLDWQFFNLTSTWEIFGKLLQKYQSTETVQR